MGVSWTAETDHILLLKILEVHNFKIDYQKVREVWPTNRGEIPTARAISERIVKIRKLNGATGTPRGKTTATPTTKSDTAKASSSKTKTPASKKRKYDSEDADADDDDEDITIPQSEMKAIRPIPLPDRSGSKGVRVKSEVVEDEPESAEAASKANGTGTPSEFSFGNGDSDVDNDDDDVPASGKTKSKSKAPAGAPFDFFDGKGRSASASTPRPSSVKKPSQKLNNAFKFAESNSRIGDNTNTDDQSSRSGKGKINGKASGINSDKRGMKKADRPRRATAPLKGAYADNLGDSDGQVDAGAEYSSDGSEYADAEEEMAV
ncbi:hypothetical protein K402DRAFT_421155 [Aulographum hederae CBS 113979]|uniref:Uncharacterized protein n=1 Tax=Aulographum hederae CBS 113979 TaxID=1176131 RepID=A0A6G1GZQ4_9PEZI|nr:hypothetical protein K402DRAFT_421155 [Aulographum hederae CBS 113979]